MARVAMASYETDPDDDTGGVAWLLEKAGVKTYSMDLTNDPRFFQDNVIKFRLQAFATMGMVSGYLTGATQGEIFSMSKDMYWWRGGNFDFDGALQFFSFFLLCCVFFLNLLATYVSVCQPYHTYRLMSS